MYAFSADPLVLDNQCVVIRYSGEQIWIEVDYKNCV